MGTLIDPCAPFHKKSSSLRLLQNHTHNNSNNATNGILSVQKRFFWSVSFKASIILKLKHQPLLLRLLITSTIAFSLIQHFTCLLSQNKQILEVVYILKSIPSISMSCIQTLNFLIIRKFRLIYGNLY